MATARHRTAAGVLLLGAMLVARAAGAQVQQPPGPYVIDVRGTTLSVPQTSDFYPLIPSTTVIPARGFGLHAGAHLYPWALRSWPVGIGVEYFLDRATATTPVAPASESAGTVTRVQVDPDVRVTQQIISPQVSLNFGTSRGWSYLSTGAGSGRVTSTAGSDKRTTSKLAVNAGAGARWFLSEHLGVGFDLRAHWLGSQALFAASAGFSFK